MWSRHELFSLAEVSLYNKQCYFVHHKSHTARARTWPSAVRGRDEPPERQHSHYWLVWHTNCMYQYGRCHIPTLAVRTPYILSMFCDMYTLLFAFYLLLSWKIRTVLRESAAHTCCPTAHHAARCVTWWPYLSIDYRFTAAVYYQGTAEMPLLKNSKQKCRLSVTVYGKILAIFRS